MSLLRSFRVPALVTFALVAILVFAGTAGAETRTGEGSRSANPAIEPELDIIKGTASYDSTSGAASFVVTTAAPPQAEISGSPNNAGIQAALISATGTCSTASVKPGGYTFPVFEIETEYAEPTAEALLFGGSITSLGPASKVVSGVTTTLSGTYGSIVNQGFNCAVLFTENGAVAPLVFPISAPVVPPPPPPPPTPPPAPAAFSIVKPKALKLKVNKWKTVHVKVTNTGATASVQGSLRVKPTKGVLVKPEVQKLPVLAPGATWNIAVQVQLTKKAKKSSTLPVTATASGVTGTSSLVVKLKP